MGNTASRRRPTTLGFAILGLLGEEPRSGYAVRRVFEETALGQYSSSPGSIYPALHRLEEEGLIRKTATKGSGGVFSLTSKGRKALKRWLEEAVDPQRVPHQVQELLLRFSFMGQGVSPALVQAFLGAFRDGTEGYADELEGFLRDQEDALPLHARVALQHGIDGYRTDARWAEWAAKALDTRRVDR